MSDCLFKELTKWDPKKPRASPKKQVAVALFLWLWLQLSTIITATAFQTFPNLEKNANREAGKLWNLYYKRGVSPTHLAAGAIFRKSLFSSVAEETLFRVFALKLLHRKLGLRPMVANFFQAIFFGSLHLTNVVKGAQGLMISIFQSAIASISFFLYGWSVLATNSIFPAVIVHFLGNLQFSLEDAAGYREFYNEKK